MLSRLDRANLGVNPNEKIRNYQTAINSLHGQIDVYGNLNLVLTCSLSQNCCAVVSIVTNKTGEALCLGVCIMHT